MIVNLFGLRTLTPLLPIRQLDILFQIIHRAFLSFISLRSESPQIQS